MQEINNHKQVHEYDGAFKCLDCGAMWGALPGRPEMPVECIIKIKIYAKRTYEELGEHFDKHASAMEDENLYSKTNIAAELAWRDVQIEKLQIANKKFSDLHIKYEKAMKRMEQEKSQLKAKNNVLDQKLKNCRLKIQSARSLLDGAFYSHDMDYDIQGVNQAHRVLDGGQPPKKTKLEE